MNLEAQCLAMAKDQLDFNPGDLISYSKNGAVFLSEKARKYETREAVVEAIRRKGETSEEFPYRFHFEAIKLIAKKEPFFNVSFWMATATVEELRIIYIKASGLWVESKDPITLWIEDPLTNFQKKVIDEHLMPRLLGQEYIKVRMTSSKPKEEEVVLPTRVEAITRCHNGTHSALDRFVVNHCPHPDIYGCPQEESFRTNLKSLIAEVRRGK